MPLSSRQRLISSRHVFRVSSSGVSLGTPWKKTNTELFARKSKIIVRIIDLLECIFNSEPTEVYLQFLSVNTVLCYKSNADFAYCVNKGLINRVMRC